MRIKYYEYNNRHIAVIGKSGSSAIAQKIILTGNPQFFDAIEDDARKAAIMNAAGLQARVSETDTPTSPIIPVRDPVERFRSACAQTRKSDQVDSVLDSLESGDKLSENFHFIKSSAYLTDDARLYIFPEDIGAIALALGFDEIPPVNDNSNNPPKPELTLEQAARVATYYSEDVALFSSIIEAGQVYTAPPVLASAEAKSAKKREVASARRRSEEAGFFLSPENGGLFIRTDLRSRLAITIGRQRAGRNPNYVLKNWKLANGSFVDMTVAQITAIDEAIEIREDALFAKEKSLADAVNAATTVEELEAIVW